MRSEIEPSLSCLSTQRLVLAVPAVAGPRSAAVGQLWKLSCGVQTSPVQSPPLPPSTVVEVVESATVVLVVVGQVSVVQSMPSPEPPAEAEEAETKVKPAKAKMIATITM